MKPNQNSWQATWLWKTLESRLVKKNKQSPSPIIAALTNWLEKINLVLTSGGTSPGDFTLHDNAHSFRVAERMAELISDEIRKNISDYELALLLLAAYLHDIGMTPERSKIHAHHRHLFDPEHSALMENEKAEFQKFLDEYQNRPIDLPICKGAPTIDDLNLADELTAFYVRHRHNDWSANWIYENLDGELNGFNDWKQVLILLCQSHHFGFEDLNRASFDPRPVGSPPQLLHLRYLACILRLADILENDPERTPEVIFRHRSIEERKQSLIFWQKDHDLTLDLQGERIVFYARPRNARVHKALLELADWIDQELQGISRFGEKLPNTYPIGKKIVHRKWGLASSVIRNIEPAPNTYEYVDGAFRPNTSRLLQLLSGEQLYGEPLAAVRELLQNAFDAVREKIARRRLLSHVINPSNPILEKQFGDEERVILTLESRKILIQGIEQSQLWLICEDTGVGLTKNLISNHLLISGQSRRHDILELERRCESAGFRLGRTGQFGVGVLSYFMLANKVSITSTRFQDCGDYDAPGWHFTTHGVGDFGELKKLSSSFNGTSGTRVELCLRPEKHGDANEFAKRLQSFLEKTLIRQPCFFRFQIKGLKEKPLIWERATGWSKLPEDFLASANSQWISPKNLQIDSEHLLSDEEIGKQRKIFEYYPDWLNKARGALRCETREINLPDHSGVMLLVLCYFETTRGRTLSYLFEDENNIIQSIKGGGKYESEYKGFRITTITETAWKGIATNLDSDVRMRTIFENKGACSIILDITYADNSVLQVSRNGFRILDKNSDKIAKLITKEVRNFCDEILSPAESRDYYLINLWGQDLQLKLESGAFWTTGEKQGFAFKAFSLPIIGTFSGRERLIDLSSGKQIQCLSMSRYALEVFEDDIIWPKPSRIKGLTRKNRLEKIQEPVAYWNEPTSSEGSAEKILFPPEWNDFLFVVLPGNTNCINQDHPIFSLLNEGHKKQFLAYENLSRYMRDNFEIPWDDLKENLSGEEAAWMLCRIAIATFTHDARNEWKKFQENHPLKVKELWDALAVGKNNSPELRFIIFRDDWYGIFEKDGLKSEYIDFSDPRSLVPKITDEDWILAEQLG